MNSIVVYIGRQADIHAGEKLIIYSQKDVVVKAGNLSADMIHIQGNQVELGTVTTPTNSIIMEMRIVEAVFD